MHHLTYQNTTYIINISKINRKVNIGKTEGKSMITKRQKEVLDFIKSYLKEKDYAPSLEEIKEHLKLSSVSTAHFHVKALKEQGLLEREDNQPRGIGIYENEPMVHIPFLGRIAAGRPIEAIEEKETIAVPRIKLPRYGECYALSVTGDSMIEENIENGDIVVIKKATIAENGQKIVALINNSEATLKKYYNERNIIRLEPANIKYSPIIIKPDQLQIQGIVVDIIKNALKEKRGESIQGTKTSDKNVSARKKIDHFLDKVIEGDCMDIMPEIPDKSVDFILCDLPYGTTQNSWDSIIPLNKLWEQYERIIKDNGVIALTSQGIFTAALILSNPKIFKYKFTWIKSKSTNFLNAKKQPLRKHEDICIFYKKQPKYHPQMSPGLPFNKGYRKNQLTGSYGDFNSVEVKSNGDRYPNDVIYFKTAESEGEVWHPTQKPVELGRYLIKTFTNPGDIVLDNACGSGSFLVSAVLEKRKFIGIEKNKETYLHKHKKVDYIEVCNERIAKSREQFLIEPKRLFD